MKLYLSLVRLNGQGYDSSGRYWGVGKPLYCYCSLDCSVSGHVRAWDREDGKEKVKGEVKGKLALEVSFFR